MNTKHLFLAAACAAFVAPGLTNELRAQSSAPGAYHGGLLGQNYSGVELSYVRHHESAPRVMRRYGFVASRPLPDGKALDGVFRYNYTRGSTLGPDGQQNDLSLGLIRYAAYGPVAPFVGADLGWAWARAGAARENSFFYQLRVGAEVMLSTAASMTPYISFQEARRFHDHAWQVGTRFAFRVSPDWSTTLALGMDDGHNVAWTFGAQPRF